MKAHKIYSKIIEQSTSIQELVKLLSVAIVAIEGDLETSQELKSQVGNKLWREAGGLDTLPLVLKGADEAPHFQPKVIVSTDPVYVCSCVQCNHIRSKL